MSGSVSTASRAVRSEARVFIMPRAIQISLSVKIPTSLPFSVTTGRAPQSFSHIIALAAARLVSGRQIVGSFVITSLIVMLVSFFGLFFRRRARYWQLVGHRLYLKLDESAGESVYGFIQAGAH